MDALSRAFRRDFRPAVADHIVALVAVGFATGLILVGRSVFDKGQVSLLYLPVVMFCGIRLGFGSAITAAVASFFCWDFFFLPPYYTLVVENPKDWLSLAVFLLAAIITARLASQIRIEAQIARDRERETRLLYEASEQLAQEVNATRLLPVLIEQVRSICNSDTSLVLPVVLPTKDELGQPIGQSVYSEDMLAAIRSVAKVALERNQLIGFGDSQRLWQKAVGQDEDGDSAGSQLGVFVPLIAHEDRLGVLYVGRRDDGLPFTRLQEQFILTAANHAAIVIARQELVGQAAEARVLREADAMKDTLLSLVSHELRTPLAAIKANASGLIGEHSYLSTAEKIEAIEAIDREVDRLALFVGNMLDLSRIEGGMWRPVRDWTDVDELVGAVVGQLPGAAAGRIAVHIDKEMPLIQIDDAQMAIVIRNLLDNALKYSAPDTQIDVSLGVLQDEDVGRCVLISVRDKGPTFSEAEAEHLFERFYRGARNPDGIPGTGLGLALCRAIVEAHGGTVGAVNVGSPEPDGVSFNIMLPFLDD